MIRSYLNFRRDFLKILIRNSVQSFRIERLATLFLINMHFVHVYTLKFLTNAINIFILKDEIKNDARQTISSTIFLYFHFIILGNPKLSYSDNWKNTFFQSYLSVQECDMHVIDYIPILTDYISLFNLSKYSNTICDR